MKIDYTDQELILLLETLGKAHMVNYMQGKDNSELQKLILKISEILTLKEREDIFDKVFMQVKK